MTDRARLYDPAFVAALFNSMGASYERVSTLMSFGFNRRWRRQLADLVDVQAGSVCADLMAGGGEAWPYLLPRLGEGGRLVAVDFSDKMLNRAAAQLKRLPGADVCLLQEDAISTSIASGSADLVYCAYGVKTLSAEGRAAFVGEVARILSPQGVCGLVEVSLPTFRGLSAPYLWYLSYVIPVIGRLALGNPVDYATLGRYVAGFDGCRSLQHGFSEAGFAVTMHKLFFGCAMALVAVKL